MVQLDFAFVVTVCRSFITDNIMFEPVSSKVDFPGIEEEILRRWETEKTFEKSLAMRKGEKAYVFYDGPPFATGLPHYGHLLAGTIKVGCSAL